MAGAIAPASAVKHAGFVTLQSQFVECMSKSKSKRKRHSKPARIEPAPRRLRSSWVSARSSSSWVRCGIVQTMKTSAPAPQSVATPSIEFAPTVENKRAPPGPAPDGMVWIPGGDSMGAKEPSNMHDVVGMQATTDSRPVHRVSVDGFWMDATEVTNEQFERFVEEDRLRHRGLSERRVRRIFPLRLPKH